VTVSPFNLVGWFRDVPLKKKLTLLFAFTSAFALLAACVSLWGYEWRTYRRALLRETVTVAEMLGDSTGAALAFNDSRAASETLSVLHAEPRIAAACLYDKYGQVFASYRFHARACPDEPGPARAEFVEGRLVVVYASQLGGVPEGNLWVAADLTEMYSRLRQLALICFGVLLGALVLAVAMSSFLQRLISGPIAGLATIAGRVTEHGDYTLRAPEVSNDEIGLLVVRFNQMMDQIHQRDLALESAQEALEDRVRARTEELENEIRHRCMVERDLVAARDLAEDSNRAKSAFLANMSHELRTPLNAIIGYSELLEEDAAADGNETAASDLRRIQSAARHLLEIIQDILDLSKIEAGRMDLHMQPMSARSLVEDVSVVEPLARKNNN
jgi:signal transduction histidine kinase